MGAEDGRSTEEREAPRACGDVAWYGHREQHVQHPRCSTCARTEQPGCELVEASVPVGGAVEAAAVLFSFAACPLEVCTTFGNTDFTGIAVEAFPSVLCGTSSNSLA